eukprot:9480074-Pyramimonas_sp.AAC.1
MPRVCTPATPSVHTSYPAYAPHVYTGCTAYAPRVHTGCSACAHRLHLMVAIGHFGDLSMTIIIMEWRDAIGCVSKAS